MFRIFFLSAFAAISFSTGAQTLRAGLYTGISFYPSTGENRMWLGKNGSTYDQFVASYNELNAATLAAQLTPLKMKPSLHVGMNFMFGVYYSEIAYNTIHGRSTAEFANGNKRVVDVKCKDVDLGMGFGYGGENAFIYVVGIGVFGFGDKLSAWTEYPDGTKSFGDENFLNGVYKVGARVGFRPGLRMGFAIDEAVTLLFSVDKLREGGEPNYYQDELAGEIELETFSGSPDNIGTDWGTYIASPLYYTGDLVRSGWSGMQIRIGIEFNFSYTN